jgi:hypothetical protein
VVNNSVLFISMSSFLPHLSVLEWSSRLTLILPLVPKGYISLCLFHIAVGKFNLLLIVCGLFALFAFVCFLFVFGVLQFHYTVVRCRFIFIFLFETLVLELRMCTFHQF